jgi:hypothetical protein
VTPLFHVSDEAGIARFEPRQIGDGPACVWAIDAPHLCNYLLPRDCPRVCFRGPPDHPLLDGAAIVIAIEAAWAARVRTGSVAVYEMPAEGFVLTDAVAGYWQSATVVTPVAMRMVADLPAEVAARGARLTALPSLWALADRVRESGLDFSLIRMRNAGPRLEGSEA